MPIYQITPNDVLFFRDARPMTSGEGSGGHGANWPLPSMFFDAIHAALYRAYPDLQEDWEHLHRKGKSSDRDYDSERIKRFGSLTTAGPFPVRNDDWLFPTPADITQEGKDGNTLPSIAPMTDTGVGYSNQPAPLRYSLGSVRKPSKEQARPWRSKLELESYLAGGPAGQGVDQTDLFDGEWTTGIGIDPETHAQNKKDIYSAEYLRLMQGVAMGTVANLPLKKLNGEDGMSRLFSDQRILIMGGQQRMCNVHVIEQNDLSRLLPTGAPITGKRVKWVLLSAAIFPRIEAKEKIQAHPGGWLPNWIDPISGQVLLKKGDTERKPKEPREEWRARVRTMSGFECRLVAAATPRPMAISGWDIQQNTAKPTHLAVPAGAVYYFEGPDANELSDALNWHGPERQTERIANRRSTLWGEKGFGLGVCGPW